MLLHLVEKLEKKMKELSIKCKERDMWFMKTESKFVFTHIEYCKMDPSLNNDFLITLKRNYYIYKYLENSVKQCTSGDILCAGISYGTSAMIASELVDTNLYGKKWLFMDPMSGDGKPKGHYNTSEELILERWKQRSPLQFIKKYLNSETSKSLPSLCFAHLNTGDMKVELDSIHNVLEKIESNGCIIWDNYGRQSIDFYKDNQPSTLENCTTIALDTRQLLIIKD